MCQDNKDISSSKLLEILEKPVRPYCAVTNLAEWLSLEEKFKLHFPTDFRIFIGAYGTGIVGDYIVIFNPFSSDKYSNFFYNMDFVLANVRNDKYFPLPLFPQSNGLLPLAKTYDGDTLWWQTQGNPDDWIVVVSEVRNSNYELYPMNLSEFLVRLIVRNKERQKDLLHNSQILKENFDRKAPFISLWTLLEKRLLNLKVVLMKEKEKGNNQISKDALSVILGRNGLELESELVQQQFENWHREGFIELFKSKEIYLRVLKNQA